MVGGAAPESLEGGGAESGLGAGLLCDVLAEAVGVGFEGLLGVRGDFLQDEEEEGVEREAGGLG